MKIINFYALLFCTLFFFPYSNAMSNEEAPYDVVDKNEVYEIRKYSDRLAAETITSGSNNSFRKLFNYISGRNQTSERISMTTPVTQVEKNGSMSMQFYLPSKFNSSNAPKPTREDVSLITVEGGYYAVLRYSGRASDKNFVKHVEILEKE